MRSFELLRSVDGAAVPNPQNDDLSTFVFNAEEDAICSSLSWRRIEYSEAASTYVDI